MLITRITQGMCIADFEENIEKQYAVIRALEIIGEAAGRISEETKSQIPTIPWADLNGMRNRLIHAYFDLDVQIVWETSQSDIPVLLDQIIRSLEKD